jgi:hypothetical protein
MHDIEPYWRWRDFYAAEDDERSPFYGRIYSEFEYTNTIYNYYLHPQWDEIGSPTLFIKILFADYDEGYAVLELIGEWNDAIHNDIMFLKREIIDYMIQEGIFRFILIGENILNFHADDDSYYEEWAEEVSDNGGWVVMVNFREHVIDEMLKAGLNYHLHFNKQLSDLSWRKYSPEKVLDIVEKTLLRYLS